MNTRDRFLTAADVLKRYIDDGLPEFLDVPLEHVNQRGHFGNYPISVAAVRGDLDELNALLDAGANVNAIGERGNTPLHEAVGQNHLETVKTLLSRGAVTEIRNRDGKTALDVARILDHKEVAALLQNHS
jgi:ankyrin repeat protein